MSDKEVVRKAIVDWDGNNILASVVQSTTDPTKYGLVICNPDWTPITPWGGWGTPWGVNTSVQYNDWWTFWGFWTYDNTTNKLSLWTQHTNLWESIASWQQYLTISSYEVDMIVEASTVYLDTTVDSEITWITPIGVYWQHLWLYNGSGNVVRLTHMDYGSGSVYLFNFDSWKFKDLYPNEGIHLVFNSSYQYRNNVGNAAVSTWDMNTSVYDTQNKQKDIYQYARRMALIF